MKRLLALHARTGAMFEETKEHVASDGGAAVLEDDEIDVKPAVSASGIAAMLRAQKQASVGSLKRPRDEPAKPDIHDSDEDDLSLLDWRGRRF